MNEAKIFLDKKQEEHFNKFGVYADVNSKIAEWMQEYTDEVVKKLTLTDVVLQSEQLNFCMHNLDLTGKCFKCGEQYIRKEGS